MELTEEETKEGWNIAVCEGNTHIKGCVTQYTRLHGLNPSGCPNCPVSFCD